MSFQAKRLRVALDWDAGVAVSDEAAGSDEPIIPGQCLSWGSSVIGSCLDFFTEAVLVESACLTVLPEKLPVYRQQLEARLAEIDAMEQRLREGGSSEQPPPG